MNATQHKELTCNVTTLTLTLSRRGSRGTIHAISKLELWGRKAKPELGRKAGKPQHHLLTTRARYTRAIINSTAKPIAKFAKLVRHPIHDLWIALIPISDIMSAV